MDTCAHICLSMYTCAYMYSILMLLHVILLRCVCIPQTEEIVDKIITTARVLWSHSQNSLARRCCAGVTSQILIRNHYSRNFFPIRNLDNRNRFLSEIFCSIHQKSLFFSSEILTSEILIVAIFVLLNFSMSSVHGCCVSIVMPWRTALLRSVRECEYVYLYYVQRCGF